MKPPIGRVLLAPTTPERARRLGGFFPESSVVSPVSGAWTKADALLGWDRGRGGGAAGALAKALGAGFVALDDGFIRSIGGPHSGAAPISLLADPIGRHFDAAAPSAIETLLASADLDDPVLLAEARDLMAFKREQGLSRYNAGAPLGADRVAAGARACVLIVDQPADDPLIALSRPGLDPFARMLAEARRDNPNATLIILRAGSARAWALGSAGLTADDVIVGDEVDVMDLIERVEAVYVVSSLIGLDALLAGRRVVCFGAPFFAGWGLTEDRGWTIDRRARRLSPEALFAGAYLMFARYVDPLTGEACAPRTAFQRLATFKQHARRVAGDWIGLNIPPPKHPVLKAFLVGPRSSYLPSPRWSRRRGPETRFAAWASKPNDAVRAARATTPDQVVGIEDGFLRSVGLGSNFHPASSLVLDQGGIYYDPSTESDLERILNQTDFDDALVERARRLRQEVVRIGLSKYNLALPGGVRLEAAAGRRTLLVPGQVEDDASVLTGGQGWSNLTLLRAVREQNPDAFILFKEHPDVTAGNRKGKVPDAEARRLSDLRVSDLDIIACIDAVDEVHTLTSLTGFEALLRGKAVATYGLPFYGGWGLTTDRLSYPRPRRALTLDALVAGVLLLYPLYVDPITRLPCDAATFVRRLEALRAAGSAPPPKGAIWGQLVRGYRATAQVIAARRLTSY